jgi:hypothetical protein
MVIYLQSLSANKVLARQMKDESDELGIPTVLMEGTASLIPAIDRRSYQRGNSIALMNYWVYFNQNPSIDNADMLIMDDAHLAEHCLHSLYSVEINRYKHRDLFSVIITELQNHYPEYKVIQDAMDDSGDSLYNGSNFLSHYLRYNKQGNSLGIQ